MTVAFETLAQQLLSQSVELCSKWLPAGRLVGREWCVGNLQNEKGQSCRINVDSGRWGDFANGQKGGDLISLYAAIHSLSQLDAARALGGDEVSLNGHAAPLRAAVSDLEPEETLDPPPIDAPLTERHFTHPQHGQPARVYVYRSQDRRPLMVVARYETADGKTFAPWTWRDGRWRLKGLPKPRPLYGLDRLEAYPGSTIIVEGEKAADALQGVTQRSSVVSWPGGATSYKHADWTVLRGRTCILWPDADTPGFAAAQGIAGLLLAVGCTLSMVDTQGLPEAFDAADLVAIDPKPEMVNAWLKPRIKPIGRPEPAPTSVLAPKTIRPAVTLDEGGERIPEAEAPAPSYSLAARYGLSFTKQGVNANLSNAKALIEGRIAEGGWEPLHYDVFLQKTMAGAREWSDHDTLRLTDEMQRHYGMTNIKKHIVEDAVTLYAYQHRRNSAEEWLRSLRYDGEPRLEQLFFRGFGAENSEYTRFTAKCFMIGMVARVLRPGCQVDTLPVLEGSQGQRKSTALRVLGGEYFSECHESVMSKDFYLVLAGKMLVEIADFHAFGRADVERVKGVISDRVDRFRAPYDRRAADHPRSCVFAATTNRTDWNRDDTGARRYWPITCTTIDVEWIDRHRLQLFAEAVARFDAGESWWDVPHDEARAQQDARREDDVIGLPLRAYCERYREVEIAAFMQHSLDLKGVSAYDRSLAQRIASTLRTWGWKAVVKKDGAGRTLRVWVRG